MAKYTPLQKLALSLAWVATITATLAGFAPRSLFLFPILSLILISALFFLKNNHRMADLQTPNKFFVFLQKIQWHQLFLKPQDRILTFLIAGLFFYLFVNSIWISEVDKSYRKPIYLLILLASWISWKKIPSLLTDLQLWRIIQGVVIGILIGALYISLEIYNGLGLTTFVIEALSPVVELSKNNWPVDKPLKLASYYFNSNVCALNLLFWPSLMIALAWPKTQYSTVICKLLPATLVISIAVLTFGSQSESAKVAFLLATTGFFLAKLYPVVFHKICLFIWTISIVATVPLILLGSGLILNYGSWLPFSAKDRIYIWHYTAVYVPESPILGKGVLSSSIMKNKKAYRKKYPKHKAKDHPGLHTHNIFLQVWYELGAVGAAFLLFLGIIILERIKKLSPDIRPFGYASFITFFNIAAFGYGLWQTWLLATYCYSAILFLLAMMHHKIKHNI